MPLTRLQAKRIQKHWWHQRYSADRLRQCLPSWKISPIASLVKHHQVPVGIGDDTVNIDEQIAPIIYRLNNTSLGVITEMSCQSDHFGRVNISMNYEKFGQLYNLITQRCRSCHDLRLINFIRDECRIEIIQWGPTDNVTPHILLTFNPTLCKRFVTRWDAVMKA